MTRLDKAISDTAYILDVLLAYRQIMETGRECNTCSQKLKCDYAPNPGQLVRYNCPLYQKEDNQWLTRTQKLTPENSD